MQSMFELCHDGNHFVTEDVTDQTPDNQMDYVPYQIFEGDESIAFHYEMFETCTCWDCGEKQWEEVMSGKWDKTDSGYCDFKNGRGAIDCEGCLRCENLRSEGQINFWYWPTWFQGE